MKAYVYVFVSLTVKVVHLEIVTDLTSKACLCRFITRLGYPSLLWSDNGSNFIVANHKIKKIIDFLKKEKQHRRLFLSFVQLTTSNGSSFLSIHHILVVFARQCEEGWISEDICRDYKVTVPKWQKPYLTLFHESRICSHHSLDRHHSQN